MIRHKLLPAIVAAAALTLGACSSTSGTPTAQDSSTSTSASETVTADAPASDTGEPASDTSAPTSDGTTTVGDGTLDAQSAAWFSTACTGLQPMGDMLATMLGVGMGLAMATGTSEADASNAAAMQKQLVDALSTAGAAMTKAEGSLASTPPPTFAKGKEMADAFGVFLKSAGSKLSEVADHVAAAPATDTASLQAALGELESLGQDEMGGADLFNQYDLSPATQAAIEEIPACKKMQDSLGGLIGAGSTTTG